MRLPPSALLETRHRLVRETLSARGLDVLLVTAPANIRYLTNHTGSAGVLVVAHDAMHLLVDFRYTTAIADLQRTEAACPSMQLWTVPGSYDEALIERLIALGVTTVGFEAGHLTVSRHEWLKRTARARGAAIVFEATENAIESLRLVKDVWEQATLRDAAARLGSVADAAFRAIRRGTTERAVAAAIETALREAGYERPAFDTIVASGPNSALPHYHAGDRALAAGDLVVLDFGGVLDGYCSDLTRTVSVGPAKPEARRVYGAVREAQEAARAAVRPGVATSDVDRAAREVLERHGLGEAFGHGTGHGLGLEIHEAPRIGRPRPDAPVAPLEAGMVCTLEPGAYLPAWGGVRIEDDVLVTGEGCEVLTSVPRDLLEID